MNGGIWWKSVRCFPSVCCHSMEIHLKLLCMDETSFNLVISQRFILVVKVPTGYPVSCCWSSGVPLAIVGAATYNIRVSTCLHTRFSSTVFPASRRFGCVVRMDHWSGAILYCLVERNQGQHFGECRHFENTSFYSQGTDGVFPLIFGGGGERLPAWLCFKLDSENPLFQV